MWEKLLLVCLPTLLIYTMDEVQCHHSIVVPYNTSVPVQAAESVSLCIDGTPNLIFNFVRFKFVSAPIITNALCTAVQNDPSNVPVKIVYFCGNNSDITASDVRVTAISQDNANSTTTFFVYAIARYLGSAYAVSNLIVAQSVSDSNRPFLVHTNCDPLNSTTVAASDEYIASTLSGMSIFASVVLILEVIIVGVFSIIWLEYGMGHLVSATAVQEITEGIEEVVTGL